MEGFNDFNDVLHKKKHRTERGNYRGVFLVVNAVKVLLKVIAGGLGVTNNCKRGRHSTGGAVWI